MSTSQWCSFVEKENWVGTHIIEMHRSKTESGLRLRMIDKDMMSLNILDH